MLSRARRFTCESLSMSSSKQSRVFRVYRKTAGAVRPEVKHWVGLCLRSPVCESLSDWGKFVDYSHAPPLPGCRRMFRRLDDLRHPKSIMQIWSDALVPVGDGICKF